MLDFFVANSLRNYPNSDMLCIVSIAAGEEEEEEKCTGA
jgi:hypothetical protein